jgi:hypothetical protein
MGESPASRLKPLITRQCPPLKQWSLMWRDSRDMPALVNSSATAMDAQTL